MDDAQYTKLMRRITTLESRLQDLVETISVRQSGTDKNPNNAVFVSDGRDGAVAKLDYDSENGSVRVTKVRQ